MVGQDLEGLAAGAGLAYHLPPPGAATGAGHERPAHTTGEIA